ncbi:MAG: hypothetical protein A2031_01705 [Deltaproteobacteria bacterium RBG_19FT_COMBO_43_11]|nr:MAG: hypothetical protein A2W27_09715 [Deltaproteobacteria bacterium RBG_16_44_11]OGP91464.1 MAG: hypothetical protein A2031_01705 [Deltaproteobacteria bacterium RBG_19FT_COMBO_43_11]
MDYRHILSKLKGLGESKRLRLIESKIKQKCKPYKLNLGCGKIRFEGWINIDSDASLSNADFCWDLRNGIPFEDFSCELIYCEHFLEHLPVHQGLGFLKECYRVLNVGGALRIAMPSLEYIIQKYCSKDWRDQVWLTWPQYQFIQSRAEMINIAFRWWGHEWLYDREELNRRLKDAGFHNVTNQEWGKSEINGLRNRESRKDSILICEVWK